MEDSLFALQSIVAAVFCCLVACIVIWYQAERSREVKEDHPGYKSDESSLEDDSFILSNPSSSLSHPLPGVLFSDLVCDSTRTDDEADDELGDESEDDESDEEGQQVMLRRSYRHLSTYNSSESSESSDGVLLISESEREFEGTKL